MTNLKQIKHLSFLLLCSLVGIYVTLQVTGCAYNSTTITAQGSVTCNASVDKPTTVNPFAGAAVPVAVGAQPNANGVVGSPK